MQSLLLAALILLPRPIAGAGLSRVPTGIGGSWAALQEGAGREEIGNALAVEGLRIDFDRGMLSIPATVLVRDELLEYVLVGPRGATHESLLLTTVTPSLVNAGLLALGTQPGKNARWVEEGVAEAPERESEVLESGARDFQVIPPEGEGLLLYLAWREGEESFLYRVDDLVVNLESGRSMRRHPWVFLGSRFHSPGSGEPEVFVADLEQNLINVSFFYQGNTLLTASLPECAHQTIWAPNSWLVPPRGSELWLVVSRAPVVHLPEEWQAALPRVEVTEASDAQGHPIDDR